MVLQVGRQIVFFCHLTAGLDTGAAVRDHFKLDAPQYRFLEVGMLQFLLHFIALIAAYLSNHKHLLCFPISDGLANLVRTVSTTHD